MSILTTAISTLTGGVLEKTADRLLDLLPQNMSPQDKQEYALKTKQLLHEQQVEFIKLAQEREQEYIKDIQNARGRESDVVSATGKKDVWLYYLAGALVIGFFSVLVMVIYKDLSDNQTANIMLGYLGGSFTSVIAYFFGSSQGSKDKTALLNTKAKQIEHRAIEVDE